MPTFGEYFAKLRRERTDQSLRVFCEENNLDPGNLSKLERGILPPPRSREKLEQYARMLKIEEGSDEWYDFFDRAAIARGQIPSDVLDNQEVVDRLPVLFRTLRGERVSEEDLAALVEMIRRS